ncbi:hypothetical protein Pmani_029223 [Petrolisthes manimaculis]|uniref:Uncharacterized protein n=1 Tax=Petrolisthes manimaculis TaxID=1843537 RepID=A0AAE1TUS9_9EUCA|nr:hypothetical protein Pmani_029223 [Petrolisthes manimaculis]
MKMQLQLFMQRLRQRRTTFLGHGYAKNVQELQQMDAKWSSASHVTNGTDTLLVLEQHKIIRPHGVVSHVWLGLEFAVYLLVVDEIKSLHKAAVAKNLNTNDNNNS